MCRKEKNPRLTHQTAVINGSKKSTTVRKNIYKYQKLKSDRVT